MSQISAVAPTHDSSYGYDRMRKSNYNLDSLNDYVYSYAVRKDERTGTKVPEPQSPMPEEPERKPYDMAVPRTGNNYQPRPEVKAGAQREQLPPLSSIFGGPRPSLPERSPTYAAGSPQNSRQSRSPAHQDRRQIWEPPYPQRPAASQYSYDSRSAQTSKPDLPPPPRAAPLSRISDAPRPYEPRYSPRDVSHPQPAASHWSQRSTEPAYREYFSSGRDTSSSFRPHSEQQHSLPPPTLGREPESRYREAALTTPSTPTYPPTPASTIVSEPVTTGDGLGPKIWTGTQFLPRFVRQAEVPGEGLCYFYDDGTHCKTHIDGEAVNAHWGVTKAGKPRKRLAIACITCREKKIKCDPDFPRCIQCEKFGRVCKFKNAPRGGHGSPETPPADVDDLVARPVSQRSDTESYKYEKQNASRSVSPRTAAQHPSPELESAAAKRRRNGYNDFTPVKNETGHGYFSQHTSPRVETKPATPSLSAALIPRWPANPFDVDEQFSTELLSIYFGNIRSTSLAFLPEKPFLRWISNRGVKKSQEDILLIYAMLSVASIFSSRPDMKERAAEFAELSKLACPKELTLQTVQARILFGFYFEAMGQFNHAWDYLGAALGAASSLGMNIEQSLTSPTFNTSTNPYGLTATGLAECRRRTFWSCYICDRIGSYLDGRLSAIRSEDIFLRVPCNEESFESQTDVSTPYFEPSATPSQLRFSATGAMACYINIATVWGDVMSTSFRNTQRSETLTDNPRESTGQGVLPGSYTTLKARLDDWRSSLPSDLSYSVHNLEQHAANGHIGTFAAMHTLYYMSHIQLNRTTEKTARLDSSQLSQVKGLTIEYAEILLELIIDVAKAKARLRDVGLLSPITGDAMVLVYDVLSESATHYPSKFSTLRDQFSGPLVVLNELSTVWVRVNEQRRRLMERFDASPKPYN